MPIQRISNQVRMPRLGKIRLGVRKEAKSGAMYPSSVEYFVLSDAPGVEEIYGKDPKELDIIFPSDELERVIPTWLKWFAGGVRDKDGNIKGGKLLCVGNGPDEQGNPGTADYYAGRDAITRVVPTRQCMGEQCPDWLDKKGNPQCKPSMQVMVILPRVSFYGVYIIDTTSWNSIQEFHNMLNWVRDRNNGIVRGIPFKIVRETRNLKYVDKKDGKEKNSTQHIMTIKPNEDFIKHFGEEMASRIQSAFHASDRYLLPSSYDVMHETMEDHHPVLEADTTPQKIEVAESLVDDKDINYLFDQLEKKTGKQYTRKARVIAIRKKEKEPNVKEAVIATLKQMLPAADVSQEPKPDPEPVSEPQPEPQPDPEPPMAAESVSEPAPQPTADADGIL